MWRNAAPEKIVINDREDALSLSLALALSLKTATGPQDKRKFACVQLRLGKIQCQKKGFGEK